MKRYFLFLILIFSFSLIQAQNVSPWKRISRAQISLIERVNIREDNEHSVLFELDVPALKQALQPLQNSIIASEIEIEIPNKKGELEKFKIHEFSNFELALQAQFPDIRSYAGLGLTDKNATVYFSMSPKGIQTMVLRSDNATEFIEKRSDGQEIYELFDSNTRQKGSLPLYCSTSDSLLNKQLVSKTAALTANNGVYKTLRLALACTGEYTAYFGGVTQALAAMNATLTRVNGIFNRDLALHLNLIANNTVLLYTNAATDPYSPSSVGVNGAWNLELQRDLTAKIGNANYDIGHLFGASGGGGNAGCIGCVCQNPISSTDLAKGSGYTSPADGKPEGDTFDIDFVAHEMGHQLGANHTFSHEVEGTGVNVEPGGGSTIMAYAGVSDFNVQMHSDNYFAFVSIAQIQNNLANKTCPITTFLSNKTPIANAGPDYSIPKGTPFILKGSGSDPNGDVLSYCWEQNDVAISSYGSNSIAYPTKIDGPLFRSVMPSTSPNRYMPALNKVLSNKLNSKWESVSDISRTLHFTLTVRDNAIQGLAQTNTDAMQVAVDATRGPFVVTSQNTKDISWVPLSCQIITWTVNNTVTLPGASRVNIKLSVDGGLTFSKTLKANTPNDGYELIIVPEGISGKNCRIMIEPTDNIFYAINQEPFAIGYTTVSSCATYDFSAPFVIPETATYTTKTIVVPTTTAVVSDVNVAVNVTHTYLSDIEMEIINPEGRTVRLFSNSCEDTNGSLVLNYDDLGGSLSCEKQTIQTVAPEESLSLYNESNPSGIWSFRVRDEFAGDIGSINAASVSICTKTYTPIAAPDIDRNSLAVFPNPNNGEFNVVFFSMYTSGVTITLHDLTGKKIYQASFPSTPIFAETIQIKGIQSGVYLLTVVDGYNETVKKIIVN
ncbi:reprolysin-like metallopeptidase [Flavobacterium sp.]|uniref:zinc-dependent metalloprotease n=1 Tax=Flavobacterium sp. TaxID=239 RepID=UPI0035AF6E56